MEYWWIILVALAAAVLPAVLRTLKLNLLDWILELFRRGGEKKEKLEPLSTVKWDCPYCGRTNGKQIIFCKQCAEVRVRSYQRCGNGKMPRLRSD